MRIIRLLSAVLIAFALSLTGVAPSSTAAQAASQMSNTMSPMTFGERKSDCSSCAPSNFAMTICVPVCVGFAAILPAAVVVTTRDRRQPDNPLRTAERLADFSSGPEPYPPKSLILV